MSQPVLSICIPTYNRARYLRCLLEDLQKNIGALTHSYEIIISDNASPDDTESAVKEFTGKLNISYYRRDKNYGGHDNWVRLKRLAQGTFQLYLADDDMLIIPEVNNVIDRMLADPAIGVTFAPWKQYDRVDNKDLGLFYKHDADAVIEHAQQGKLLGLILQHHLFPEIYIIRTDLARAASVFTHDLAYWAFVQAAEYLSFGKVLFSKEPFYISVTRYFADEGERGQFGHAEVQDHWDRYRSGLEYILSRLPEKSITQEQANVYFQQIQKFIAVRLHFTLKFRIAGKRDPIDTYYLACRLKAMGYANLIPAPFGAICGMAIVHYLLTSNATSDTVKKIVCVEGVNPDLRKMLAEKAEYPVEEAKSFVPSEYSHALVLIPGSIRNSDIDHAALVAKHVRVLGVADLLQKFA